MTYQELVKENSGEFFRNLQKIAGDLGLPFDWLQHIIYIESGFNHRAKNSIGAVGLIQFTKTTAKGLGTTAEDLMKMSNVQQLQYVKKYFLQKIAVYGKPKTLLDTYLLVFYPAMFGQADSYTLPQSAYAANRGMDTNNDGKISRADVRSWLHGRLGMPVTAGVGPFWGIIAAAALFILIIANAARRL